MKFIKNHSMIEAFQFKGKIKNSQRRYCIPEWAIKELNKTLFFVSGELLLIDLHGNIMDIEIGDYLAIDEEDELYIIPKEVIDNECEVLE